jgi:hypothetical protein
MRSLYIRLRARTVVEEKLPCGVIAQRHSATVHPFLLCNAPVTVRIFTIHRSCLARNYAYIVSIVTDQYKRRNCPWKMFNFCVFEKLSKCNASLCIQEAAARYVSSVYNYRPKCSFYPYESALSISSRQWSIFTPIQIIWKCARWNHERAYHSSGYSSFGCPAFHVNCFRAYNKQHNSTIIRFVVRSHMHIRASNSFLSIRIQVCP